LKAGEATISRKPSVVKIFAKTKGYLLVRFPLVNNIGKLFEDDIDEE